MKVLVACEFSGIVRDAFRARGHDAWSCDLLPTERDGPHLQCDVHEVLNAGWDLMIAHPPCTYLSGVGERWFKVDPDRERKSLEAALFVFRLWDAPIRYIAIENPRGRLTRFWRQPDQVIDPTHFGASWNKQTCLWLRGLPPLLATIVHTERQSWVGAMSQHNGTQTYNGGHRSTRARSKTFPEVAAAMADQWGAVLERAA